MAAYFIVQIDVTDPEAYETYRQQVPPTLAKYGGEFIVRGGDMEVIEGDWPWPRCVVVKFEDREAALSWYNSDDYNGPKAIRHAASNGNMVLVEGV